MEIKNKKPSASKFLDIFLKLLHRYFFILAFIVFFVILAVGYIFLVQPKYKNVTEKQKTEENKKVQELESLSGYLKKMQAYREEYNKISQADKERVDAMIAGKYLPENVFTDMEKLIFSRGMILDSIEVNASTPDKKTGTGEAVIKLDISGVNYEDFKKLLAVFENSLRLMDVKSLSFSPSQNTALLVISTYYLK